MRPTERISGPWRTLFVAAYAAPFEGLFYGYAKVFECAPDHPWAAGALVKVASGVHAVELDAIDEAESHGIAAATGIADGLFVVVRTQLVLNRSAARRASRIRPVS